MKDKANSSFAPLLRTSENSFLHSTYTGAEHLKRQPFIEAGEL